VRSFSLIATAVIVGLLIGVTTNVLPALAAPGAGCGIYGNCKVKASKDGNGGSTKESATATSRRVDRGPTLEQQLTTYLRASKKYYSQLGKYEDCLSTGSASCNVPAVRPELQGALGVVTGTPGGAPAPQMSPGQAGAIAVARLQLPLNAPAVGPDPSVNKWKMAAVGYPLWVWADGPTHVGPVSDSVAGLSVSLDAQLTKTVFRMGDGQTVTCRDGGTPYRKGTAAGTPSPDCGYRYENPSLPKGDYTVTAIGYWAVTWTINGTSGVITVPRAASAPLPVGEVQVLVR
jgi:hypothetical protein